VVPDPDGPVAPKEFRLKGSLFRFTSLQWKFLCFLWEDTTGTPKRQVTWTAALRHTYGPYGTNTEALKTTCKRANCSRYVRPDSSGVGGKPPTLLLCG
jgi:hypothetical protein